MAKSKSDKKFGWKCSETSTINYVTAYKEKTTGPREPLKRMKFCRKLKKHTLHTLVKLK